MRSSVFVLLVVIALSIGYYFTKRTTERNSMELNYIVTETKGPDSFDPVNADKTQNLSVMRMLFATPIEVDKNNSLQSKILKSFEYKRDRNQIVFEVKTDQKYSDGTILTAEDVAIAIARMAYYRPQFPVIKEIEGVQAWADSKKGLNSFPSGIKVENHSVIITLTRQSANPLFRFCLELFSVIPSKCINKDTVQMNCDLAPSSGYYTLKSRSADGMVFEKRKGEYSVDPIPFEIINFKFKSLLAACKDDLEFNEVISGVELDYLATDCSKELSTKQIHWMPSARFSVLRFNPHVAPFNQQVSRQLFAEMVRDNLRKKNDQLLVVRGLFSILLPGYLANEKLSVSFDEKTKEAFKGVSIYLPNVQQSGLKIVFDAIIETAKELQMDVQFLNQPTNDALLADFLSGRVPVVAGASGFWAQDPIGDISMWFTPNLHKTMSFVWSDKKIYEQIHDLESEVNPATIRQKMESFNSYISGQAVLAPVVHFRRLFISSKHVTNLNLPQAVTSPAPWQLVPVE